MNFLLKFSYLAFFAILQLNVCLNFQLKDGPQATTTLVNPSNKPHQENNDFNHDCKYKKGVWQECDSNTGIQKRMLKLKYAKNPTANCTLERVIERPCKRQCKYIKGTWSECNNGFKERIDKLRSDDSSSFCKLEKIVNKACKKQCSYEKSEWSSCENGFKNKTLTLIKNEANSPNCEPVKTIICLLFALIRVCTKDNSTIDDNINKIISIDNECINLKPESYICELNYSCIYGQILNATCEIIMDSKCHNTGKLFSKTYQCAFCYQLPPNLYDCVSPQPCPLYSRIKTMCTVSDDTLCLGQRKFYKYIRCEYKSRYKWSTALLLSVTLGGFGIDRFYLGNWQEGVGKLFSFGGLGVWTLIDVILIATGYLKPNDGSFYVYD